MVHDARVAVRRLRSMLRVFPALQEVAAEGLAERLSAWSDRLGAVRDLEAVSELLADVCDQVHADAVWSRLRAELDAEAGPATAELIAALDSDEHRRLVEDVEALALTDPGPLSARAGARRAARKARKRLRRAGDDAALLHRARRAAKRARYAAEAVGDSAAASYWKDVQGTLGVHHDCVVALERLDGVPGAEAAGSELRARMAAAIDGGRALG